MLWSRGILPVLLLSFVAWGAIFYTSIASTVAIWYRSETFAHGFIILPICIYLLKLKWPQLARTPLKIELRVLLLVIPVLAVWLLGAMANLLVVEQAATFMLLPLIIWTACGNQAARVMLFPLLFWLFSVPGGEFMVPQLQELTADITVWALQLSSIPVFREGLYIAIPGGLFEVAVACSGIRYLIASFTIGSLYAYLNYHSTKKRVIFILFSIVLPLIANGVRAYMIVLIAYLSDMKYATGVDHLVYGWVFFGLVILMMFAIGNRWAEQPKTYEAGDKPVVDTSMVSTWPAVLGIGALIAGTFAYHEANRDPAVNQPFSISSVIEIEGKTQDLSWLPIFKNATEMMHGTLDGVDYFAAYYQSNEQDKELINTVNQPFNSQAWTIVSRSRTERFDVMEITNARGKRRLLTFGYATAWMVSPQAVQVKLSQAAQAFLGEPQTGIAIVVSVEIQDSDREAKLQQLTELSEQVFSDRLSEALPRE